MAKRLVPTKQALEEINNSRDRKATQLGQIYSSLGGSDSTLKPNYAQSNPAPTASIPVLERAVEDTYNALRSQSSPLTNANNGNSANARVRLQNGGSAYQAYKNDITGKKLADIGQTDLAPISTGHFMGMGLGTGLTQEMKDAGLTREDLEAYNRQQNQQILRDVSNQIADEHPVAGTLASPVINALSSATNLTQNSANYLTGKPMESLVNPATEIRQNVSEQINNSDANQRISDFLTNALSGRALANTELGEKLRDKISGITNNAGSYLYNTGNSILDMLAAIAMPGVPANITLGLEKADDVVNGAIERGLTPDQIAKEGAGSFLTTAITEMLPLGRLSQGGNILLTAAAEGLQEGAEDLADTLLDQIVTRAGGNVDKSELSTQLRNYLSAGYSQDDAVKAVRNDYIKTLLLDTLAGGISGGALGAGSNVMQGRNAFTGRIPTLETQTQNVNQTIPEVTQQMVDRINEERAAQNTRNEDNARLNEALAKIEELRRQNEAANNDPELMNYLRDILSSTADESRNWKAAEPTTDEMLDYMRDILTSTSNESQNWENRQATIPTVNQNVEQNVRPNEQSIQTLNSPEQNARSIVDAFIQRGNFTREGLTSLRNELGMLVESNPMLQDTIGNMWNEVIDAVRNQQTETQAPQNTPTENVGLSRREQTQYRRQTESLMSNLQMFPNTEALQNQLTTAYENLANNPTAESAQNYNRVVDEINNVMADETISTSMRDEKSDYYNAMKDLTDNKVIRVSRDMINQLGLNSVRELNNNVYTGKNSIVFRTSKGTPIDSAYMELYDLAHGSLPSPQNMAEGDLLNALYEYITSAKTDRDDVGREERWQDVPLLNMQTELDRRVEDLTDDIMTKIDDNTITQKDYEDYLNSMIELQDKYPDKKKELYETFMKVYEALNEEVANADVDTTDLDEAEDLDDLTDAIGETLQMAEELEEELDQEELDQDELVLDASPARSESSINTGRWKNSQGFLNTLMNNESMTEREITQHIQEENMLYQEVHNDESVMQAIKNLAKNGYKAEVEKLMHKDKWTQVDSDENFILWKDAVNVATQLSAEGKDASDAWDYAVDLIVRGREQVTNAAQVVQSWAKWSMQTPEGELAQAMRAEQEAKKANKTDPNWSEVEKGMGKQKSTVFTKDFIKQYLQFAHQYDGQKLDPYQKLVFQARKAQMINSQLPIPARIKFKSFLMDNMLFSIRTLLSRNFGGNFGLAVLDQTATKLLSGGVDAAVAKKTGRRTTTGFTWQGLKEYGKGFGYGLSKTMKDAFGGLDTSEWRDTYKEDVLKGIKKTASDLKEGLKKGPVFTARSGESEFKGDIQSNKRIYKNKLLNACHNLVGIGLALGDNPYYEAQFRQSMYEYNRLYKEGKLGEKVQALSPEEFQKIAEGFAVFHALQSVYQNDTTVSRAFANLKKAVGQASEGYLGVDLLSQATLPYVRTPANVALTNFEYSPFGIVKNAIQTIREVNADLKRAKGKEDSNLTFNQDRFVRETCRNIVGTALFAIAYALADAGKITGGYSDDDDMKQAQRESGMQEYAWVKNNGEQVQLSWLPVLGNATTMGAAVHDAMSRPGQTTGEAIASGIKEGLSTQFDNSMLQGFNRLFGSQLGRTSGGIINNAADTIGSAITQLTPAWLRQLAQTTDPYQRNIYDTDTNTQKYLNSLVAGIPILRQNLLEPKIGRTGEPLEQNAGRSLGEKIFDNFVNPAIVTEPNPYPDDVRDEAMRLFEAYEGDARAFEPKVKFSDITTADHTPTEEEYREYQQTTYRAMNDIASDVIHSDYYNSLEEGDKIDLLASLYSAVKSVETRNVTGADKDNLSGAAKAYDEDGADGLVDYLMGTDILRQLGIKNDPDLRGPALELLDEYDADEIPDIAEDYQDAMSEATRGVRSFMRDNSALYSGLKADEKDAVENTALSAIRSVETKNLLGMDTSNLDGADKAYLEGGIDGLNDYIASTTVLDQMGVSNSENNREAVAEYLHSNGASAVSQAAQQCNQNISASTQSAMMNLDKNRALFSGMSEEDRTALTDSIESAIRSVEFRNAMGMDTSTLSGAAKAYAENGVEGLNDYVMSTAILSQMGVANNASYRDTVLDTLNNEGARAVQDMISNTQELAAAGMPENMVFKYDHATNYIPTLSPTEFANTWNAMNTDNNTSIKQSEIIDYLNQNPSSYNAETALQYWRAYDQHSGSDDQWKAIPVLNTSTGLWEAK